MSLSEVKENREASLLSCTADKCSTCAMRSGSSPCKGCLPEGGFKNMGEMWEVVKGFGQNPEKGRD